MRTNFIALFAVLIFGACSSAFAQPGVLDPNDPDVIFTENNRPPVPTYNNLSKWGHAQRLSWNGQRPFNYGFKSYYFKGMAFRIKFPKTYQHNVADGKKYPVFFFLHGMGERGEIYDNEYQLYHGGQLHAERVNDGTFDGFLVYSQSQNGYHNAYFPKISELIDTLVKYVKADIDRVIISGLSSGGQSTWDFLADYSADFSAAIPISAAQAEDKPTFSRFVTIPIWTANGGLDGNPDPTAVTDVINYFRSLGGSIKQNFYPNAGHSIWGNLWSSDPAYFPALSGFHKANPHVFFERTEFCPDDNISVKLGLQPGFYAYEWQYEGATILGATTSQYTATKMGTYRARFKRTASSAWSDWSPTPVKIQLKVATVTPPIQINGIKSKVLPAPDGSTTVPLMVPATYASYEWRRVSDNALVGNGNILNAPIGQYKVRVTETFGCSSSFSEPFEVINAQGASRPENPSALTVSTASNSSLRLDWNDNPNPLNNETGFEIYQASQASGPFSLVAITPGDILTYLNTGLNPKTTYYYLIRAVNENGASESSKVVSATTASDTQVPTAPTNLIATNTSRHSISLAWQPANDDVGVSKYDIFVDGRKAYSTGETSFTVYNLTQGQQYAFSIQARDVSGNLSPFSNQITAQAIERGLKYKYYHGAFNTLPDFTKITPVYTGTTANVDITQRSRNDEFAFLWEGTLIVPTSGTYYIRTRSDDGSKVWLGPLNGSNSPYSFASGAIVDNDGTHGAQDRTSAALNLTAGSYPIAIAYFDRSGSESMAISWSTPQTGASTFVGIPNVAFSDASTITTPPAAPSNLVATGTSYNKIVLTWNDNSNNESGFEIWRSTSVGGDFVSVGRAKANQTSFTDTLQLSPSTNYYYRIRTVGPTGESGFVPGYDVQALWRFNNDLTDASGNSRTLVHNGGLPAFTTTEKQEGTHAINLDGTDDDLTIPTTAGDFITNGYASKTVAFWMKADVNNSNRGIFDLGGSDDGLAMRLNANQLVAGIASNNTRRSLSVSYNSLVYNHIALVYKGNTLRLFVNATEVASNTNLGFNTVTSTIDGSMIGDDQGSTALNTSFGQFDGKIDNFWIFGEALTQAEIAQVMNNSLQFQALATTQALPQAPAKPSSLLVVGKTTSTIDIKWTDNSSNETGFEIWRSVNNNTSFRLLGKVNANVSTYSDKDLFANVTYYYKILATGTAQNSGFSNEITTTTANNLPEIQAVPNFTMRHSSIKVLDLSATDADGENLTFTVQNLPPFATFSAVENGKAQFTFTPSSAQLGTHNISVTVSDAHNGTASTSFQITVNSNYLPTITPIGNITLKENSLQTINLFATDQDGNENLQWQSVNLPAFATLAGGSNGNATLTLAPNFAQAGTYPVAVSVADGAGGVASQNFTVVVSNEEPSTNKWFVNIQYNQLPGGPAPWNNVNSLSTQNLKDQNSASSTVGLQFLTTAWNAFNGGATTNNNTGIYPDNVLRDYYYFGIFGAPETVNFRVTGLDKDYKYNLTLLAGSSWTGVADNGTTVFTIGGVSKSLYTQNNTQNTVTFTTLTPDASGNITVTMSKASGSQVGYLNAFVLEKIFDDGTAPIKPTNLRAEAMENGSIKMNWVDVAYNELKYEVYRSTSENGTYTLLNPNATNSNATEHIDNTVNGLTRYYYQVAAVNNYGSSGLTDAVTVVSLNKAPVVAPIANVFVKAGNTQTINLTFSDDASEALIVSVANLPSFAQFTPGASGVSKITITPTVSDLGLFKDVSVKVTDPHGSVTEQKFDIFVADNATRSFYVNIAGETGTPQGRPWNNLISYPFAGTTLNNLTDEQNAASGYAFRLVDSWNSSWKGGMITGNNSGIYPDNVIQTSIYEGSTNAKRIQFTGLNTSKVYNVAVFSSNNAGFDASFTITSGGQSVVSNGRFNSIKATQLNGLTPNASGVIELTITKAGTANYVFVNAVVLQEYDQNSLIRPVDLFTEINAPGKINLSWSDRSNNETGFEIWRATIGTTYSLLASVPANTTIYTDNSAAKNKPYYYKVKAKQGTVGSEFSNTANAVLGSSLVLLNFNLATPEPAPWNNTNNTPQVNAAAGDLKNTLGNNTGYLMELTNDWGGYFDLGMTNGILPNNVMLTSWWIEGNSMPGTMKLSNLDQSKKYRIGFMGSSSWEGDFTATYTINNRTVYLNSHKNDSKIVYIDDVTANGDGEIDIVMGYLSSTRWSFLSALIIESYDDYSNAAPPINNQTNILVQKQAPKAISITNELAERSSLSNVRIIPNPFNDHLTLLLDGFNSNQLTARLFDMTGKLLLVKNLAGAKGSGTISLYDAVLSSLTPGTYILELSEQNKTTKSFKLIKQR